MSNTSVLPGWLNVKDFGAKGDLQAITDGVMTKGSAVLTSAAGRFTPADVGKLCTVDKAVSAVASLSSIIVAWQSATQVVLRDAAGVSVTHASAIWGTDDTKAIQAAIDAIDVCGGGTIYFPPGTYYIHGELGGAHGENSQLQLPSLNNRSVPITFLGSCKPVMGLPPGLADNQGGSVLFSDGQSDGDGSMIGVKGPTSINPSKNWPFLSNVHPHFENMYVTVTDFRTVQNGTPFGPSITALNLFNAQAASTRNVAIRYRAPNCHTAAGAWCGSNAPTSYPHAAGIKFPQNLNNIHCTAEGDLAVYNFPTGVVVSELFCGFRVSVHGCHTGLFIGPATPSLVIQHVVSQWNHFGIAVTEECVGDVLTPHLVISNYSVEVDQLGCCEEFFGKISAWTGDGDDYHDPKDAGRGLINYCAFNLAKGFAELRVTNGGQPKIKIVNLGK